MPNPRDDDRMTRANNTATTAPMEGMEDTPDIKKEERRRRARGRREEMFAAGVSVDY